MLENGVYSSSKQLHIPCLICFVGNFSQSTLESRLFFQTGSCMLAEHVQRTFTTAMFPEIDSWFWNGIRDGRLSWVTEHKQTQWLSVFDIRLPFMAPANERARISPKKDHCRPNAIIPIDKPIKPLNKTGLRPILSDKRPQKNTVHKPMPESIYYLVEGDKCEHRLPVHNWAMANKPEFEPCVEKRWMRAKQAWSISLLI